MLLFKKRTSNGFTVKGGRLFYNLRCPARFLKRAPQLRQLAEAWARSPGGDEREGEAAGRAWGARAGAGPA